MTGNSENHSFVVTGEEDGSRLDKILVARFPTLSRTQLQEMIKEGAIRLDGELSKASYRVSTGERIEITIRGNEPSADVLPEAIPLDVLYEDEYLAVVNKPAGMVVHLGHGNESGTLVNALLDRWSQIAKVGDIKRAGIVHRLDKGTSGVILVALTPLIQRELMEQFKQRTVKKVYQALVEGQPGTATGRIEAPVGRDPVDRKLMSVQKNGRPAVTTFHSVEYFQRHTLLEIGLETGRTHQIRVHMKFIGCPVVGDQVYGFRKKTVQINRLFLHAKSLSFSHPVGGKTITIDTDLPPELQVVLSELRG